METILWGLLAASVILNVGLVLLVISLREENRHKGRQLSRFGVFDHDGDGKPGGSRKHSNT